MEEDRQLEERKEKAAKFLKEHRSWAIALVMFVLAYFSYWLRTRNLSGLHDITTGEWTLGPDLDPFLFLRWAKQIVSDGSLMAVDPLRYVPIPYYTSGELPGLPYLIAWFHTFASPWWTSTVEHSAVIFPAFMFALTVATFFLLVQCIFKGRFGLIKANVIASIASFFLIVTPSLLPRTVAGIPEKESAGFFFLFLALYAFINAWNSKTTPRVLAWSGLTGIATAAMHLTWGGVAYVYFTVSVSLAVAFILGQLKGKRLYIPALWLLASVLLTFPFTTRVTLTSFLTSIPSLITLGVLAASGVLFLLSQTPLRKYGELPYMAKIPKPVLSLLIIIVLGVLASFIITGPDLILGKIVEIKNNLGNPITDRLGVTVAENRQPFFSEWANNFGPVISGVPLVFWLFFIGAITLFYNFSKELGKKEQIIITVAYFIFLICTIFSRYEGSSLFNGDNLISKFVYYVVGFGTLVGAGIFAYYQVHRRHEEERLQHLDMGIIVLLVLFFLSIASARGAVRLIMLLVPPAAILVAYLAVAVISLVRTTRDDLLKSLGWIALVLVLGATIFAGVRFYEESKGVAQSYVPSVYTQQWQKAMAWVRTETPENAVFAHWWDYGYWVQSIGNRATILDGGNAIPYWNHLMGRHVLTGRDRVSALEFLYTHKATHVLIDSSDIGKYGAFSSIGSDENYDRRSWIPTFSRQRVEEAKNRSIMYYPGGFPLDQDMVYTTENETIHLPEGKAALGMVTVEMNKEGTLAGAPRGTYVHQKNRNVAPAQYTLPLRYAYHNGTLYDFKKGVEAGVVFIPAVTGQGSIERDVVLMYLSNKTVQSHLARLYLYEEKDPNFVLTHSEDDYIVGQLKSAGLLAADEDFVVYQGLRGPIRIWEIRYPEGMAENPSYLSREYPEHLRRA